MSKTEVVSLLNNRLKKYQDLLFPKKAHTVIRGANYIVLYHDIPRSIKRSGDIVINSPGTVSTATYYSKRSAEDVAKHFGEGFVACHWMDHVKSEIVKIEQLLKDIEVL